MDDRAQIVVLIFSIFGKGSDSAKCINCGDFKNLFFNMSEELFSRYRKLWSYLNQLLNQQTIYQSSQILK
jgi:hypothetical protein